MITKQVVIGIDDSPAGKAGCWGRRTETILHREKFGLALVEYGL